MLQAPAQVITFCPRFTKAWFHNNCHHTLDATITCARLVLIFYKLNSGQKINNLVSPGLIR